MFFFLHFLFLFFIFSFTFYETKKKPKKIIFENIIPYWSNFQSYWNDIMKFKWFDKNIANIYFKILHPMVSLIFKTNFFYISIFFI